MCGIVEFIKHELSAYFDQTYFIPFLREWRKREDGKRYAVHLNGYQLTPVFVIPNFKISLGKGQDESGGQIQMKWRNWRFGSLGDGERGEEGRKKSMSICFSIGIMNSVPFLHCRQECFFLSCFPISSPSPLSSNKRRWRIVIYSSSFPPGFSQRGDSKMLSGLSQDFPLVPE